MPSLPFSVRGDRTRGDLRRAGFGEVGGRGTWLWKGTDVFPGAFLSGVFRLVSEVNI